MPNLPFCHWSSQLFDLRAPLSTDVLVLLLNQPINWHLQEVFPSEGCRRGRVSYRSGSGYHVPRWCDAPIVVHLGCRLAKNNKDFPQTPDHRASRQPYVRPSYTAIRKVMVIARLLLFASFLLSYLLTLLSMGDNLLLMDSPAPNLKSSGAVSRRAYTDPSTAQNAESPCGVDKLLNFSPSKLSEVTSQNLSQK